MRLIVGGGSGLESTLKAIGDSKENIVLFTVVDSGGDTGKIRKEYPNMIPVGDVKKHVWAFKPSIEFDFITQYGNHKFWNLIVFELMYKLGPNEGLNHLRKMLGIKSEIYPVSLQPTNLYAKLENEVVKGEHIIENIKERIYKVWIEPKVKVNPILKDKDFDIVILGPGSMYGSQISNLLVDGFIDLIKDKEKVLIVNGIKRFEHITSVRAYVKEFEKYGYKPDVVIAPKGMEGNADYFVETIDGKYNIRELSNVLEGII